MRCMLLGVHGGALLLVYKANILLSLAAIAVAVMLIFFISLFLVYIELCSVQYCVPG